MGASFVLLTISASAERVRGRIADVMVSMVSSLIFLIGIALILRRDGHARTWPSRGAPRGRAGGTRGAFFAVLLVAFGIKAPCPLSAWFPDS